MLGHLAKGLGLHSKLGQLDNFSKVAIWPHLNLVVLLHTC